jgi:hypothetical protein
MAKHNVIEAQVQLRVDRLVGCLPAYRDAIKANLPGVRPSALYVEAQLCEHGETLGIPARTCYAEADLAGCSWDTWLTLPTKVHRQQGRRSARVPACLLVPAWPTLTLRSIGT